MSPQSAVVLKSERLQMTKQTPPIDVEDFKKSVIFFYRIPGVLARYRRSGSDRSMSW
jgi:hypothetical protein